MLYIGSDHGGFNLKEHIKNHLEKDSILFEDLGVYTLESFDYPIIAEKLCKKIIKNESNMGILICGTGIGVCIAANKIKGIRAALCSDTYTAEMSRKHNNANVLCMGGRILGNDSGVDIVKSFLSNEFEGGRHSRRINQITEIENQKEQ